MGRRAASRAALFHRWRPHPPARPVRDRRITQVAAALGTTALAVLVVLNIVGVDSSVQVPAAVDIHRAGTKTAVSSGPTPGGSTIPGATIIYSVPKVIEGVDKDDGEGDGGSADSGGNNGGSRSSRTTTTTDQPGN